MAKRGHGNFDLIWVHLDARHPAYGAILDTCRRMHEQYGPKLSVNLKADGSEALVKVAVISTWPALNAWGAALIRVYTEADHAAAIALVKATGWEPEE